MGLQKDIRKTYIRVFFYAMITALVIFVPLALYRGGYFIFAGDFNVQQIPFYRLANEAVKSGDFLWNWTTDLGVNFISSYSFYLLGSPFFLITLLFPSSFTPFLMAPLLVLKFALSAVFACAFVRRFVKDMRYAILGGLLYAFSGFAIYNVFFNHFNDVIVFFPLLLIALEEFMQNGKRGYFAFAVAMMAVINYFFFVGQVVFVLLYFFIRVWCGDFKLTMKKFLSLVLEAILGFAMSLFIVLPSVLTVMGNPRVDNQLAGYDLLMYGNTQRYAAIIQSLFFPPDSAYNPAFFPDAAVKWTSLNAYLPLFSVTGALAYMMRNKRTWITRLLKVSLLMILVPFLNSIFYLFNNSFYARWFYMPVLIMAVATAISFERFRPRTYRRALGFTAVVTGVIALTGLLPTKKDGEWQWFNLIGSKEQFWVCVCIAVLGLVLLLMIIEIRRDGRGFMRKTIVCVCLIAVISSFTYLTIGRMNYTSETWYINNSLEIRDKIDLPETDQFSRIDTLDCTDNQGMFMGLPTISAFHSIIPNSIMEFYPLVGVKRDVSSKPDPELYGLRALLSVKWQFIKNGSKETPTYGFSKYGQIGDMTVYKNDYFVPMGFAYSFYVTEKQFMDTPQSERSRLLNKAVVLSEEQIERYGKDLLPLPEEMLNQLNQFTFEEDITRLQNSAASDFTTSGHGFTAKINLDRPGLVFFSVPYEEGGWTATVNGKAADVENVSVGFMAVWCEAGESEIVFDYMTPGLKTGTVISVVALLLTGGWIVIARRKKTQGELPPSEEN